MTFLNKLSEFFKKHWVHILILILIFLVAFGMRTLILRYDLMFEFDSYWHARMNANLIDTGIKPTIDTMGTYHLDVKPIITWAYGSVLYYTGYLAYKIFYFGAAYDQEKWIFLVRLLPALYGALIALAMYLLFRWGFNSKKIGYIAGFVTAIMPAFIYRQMGGFYEEDSYGFLWMVLGFAFLIKALKEPKFSKSNIIYSTLSGIMFGLMAFTWSVFVIVPVIIEAYFIFTLIWALIKKIDKKTIYTICGLFAITFVLTGIFGFLAGTNWFGYQVNYAKGFLGIGDGQSVNTQDAGQLSARSVGEEAQGKYSFPNKYGVFLAFIILGLIALVYSIYKDKYIQMALLTLCWSTVTFYLAWNKLKATYWFGGGLAVLTAFTIATLIAAYREEKINTSWKIAGITLCVLLLFGGTASGVIFTYNHAPNIVTEQGWKDSLVFMKDNLPENAKMFNWWSWGHWITYMGHKRASTDNTNGDQQANGDFGAFFVTKDSKEALGIIKAYDADYVVYDYKALLEMGTYTAYANELQKNKYDAKNIFIAPFACQPEQNLNTLNYTCNSLFTASNGQRMSSKFNASQMFSFPSTYTNKPNNIWQNKIPVIYYTTINKSLLLIIDTTTNNSYGLKLWFNAEETKPYFTPVYDNGFVKIWKVNKDAFKDVKQHMTGLTEKEIDEWNSKLYWLDQNTVNPIAPIK